MDDAEMDAFVANISDTVSGRAAKTVIVALRAALAKAEHERDRLRNGGCARDQKLTQHCTYAQAAEQAKQIAERDAVRLSWLERTLFERKWDGTIGRPSSWFMAGPYRHTMHKMHGETLRAAIDSAISAQLSGEER